jgi:hypothetical protein
MYRFFDDKYLLVVRTLPALTVLLLAKWLLWSFAFQPLPVSTLTSSLIAATVFVMGFLISGALPDYKEAEKIPGELSASFDAIGEEYQTLRDAGAATRIVDQAQTHLAQTADATHRWFHRTERTKRMLEIPHSSPQHRPTLLFV